MKIKEQTRKLAGGCSKKLAAGCSKHCFSRAAQNTVLRFRMKLTWFEDIFVN
ncbi:hypothetical protein [Streptococcus pneumoniae]|uniref:hypothetical protein n=1 Tax=Streptococcus pneumoniae TaxID=1313 RepID=UPI0015D81B1E|nr:hypothetical protein [Streptococcus pneumoniae]